MSRHGIDQILFWNIPALASKWLINVIPHSLIKYFINMYSNSLLLIFGAGKTLNMMKLFIICKICVILQAESDICVWMTLLAKLWNIIHNQSSFNWRSLISMVSCQKGHTRHAYAWQIGPFWQDTLAMSSLGLSVWDKMLSPTCGGDYSVAGGWSFKEESTVRRAGWKQWGHDIHRLLLMRCHSVCCGCFAQT